ncbi:MAG: aminopeptidase P family protein [Saprospiraceae bacterium]
MRYEAIEHNLFITNRQRFMRKMQADSIAIFHSNDLMPRSGNVFYPFRQNSGLFYLSGLDQVDSVVVLFPDCVKEGFREIAFIKRNNAFNQIWEGSGLSKSEAREISGIHQIFWIDEMEVILHELILLAKRIYVNTEEHPHRTHDLELKNHRFTKQLMKQYPAHKYHRAQPLLKKIMMIKQAPEVAQIQKAIQITEGAFRRILPKVKPGQLEYEIEAEITYEFTKNGANGHAYPPIVASGIRTCVLHYTANNQVCANGDLLLLDIGAEYANYTSDITRVIPVNGRFNQRQRAVYQAVLKVLKTARQMLVPGVLLDDYHQEVGRLLEGVLIDLGLLSPKQIAQQNPAYPLYKKYCMHQISHHLGLGVHDLANYYDPIMAGMVFTCEPGIYIPEEKIGIRLENDILVTDQGPIDLSQDIPIEVDEIEALMHSEILTS